MAQPHNLTADSQEQTEDFGHTASPFRHFSLSNSFLADHRFSRRSSTSSCSDDQDIDDLHLSLAQVVSFTPGSPYYSPFPYYPELERKPSIRKADAATSPETYGTFQDDVETGEALLEDDGKYIGIGAKRFWPIFGLIMLGYFIACFDSTLMASSHPVITSYFGASQAASWLSTVFLITSTAFQPLFGRLSDTIGRKTVFLLSLLIFGATTMWCAIADSIENFIAARAVCGLGAGGTMSMSLIIISDLVRIEHRGVFQSYINVAFGLGSASGAALGGWFCDTLGWRWVFGIQVPPIMLCLIMAMFFMPSGLGPMLIKEDGAWTALRSFDWYGSQSLVISVTSLILFLNLGGNILPWTSPVVLSCLLIFLIAATAFVFVENRATYPLMPLRLLRKTPIANLIFANLFGGIASNTVLFNVPIFFQAVLLTSASSSGFRLAIPSLFGSLAGISTGIIITYTRRLKPTLNFGAVMYLVGSGAILCLSKNTSEIMSMILITGVPSGQGFVFPNTMMSALAVSDQMEQAVVTTTIGMWRNLGVVMGVALSSFVFQNSLIRELQEKVGDLEVIRRVRTSVGEIRLLAEPVRSQGESVRLSWNDANDDSNRRVRCLSTDVVLCEFTGRSRGCGFGNTYPASPSSPWEAISCQRS